LEDPLSILLERKFIQGKRDSDFMAVEKKVKREGRCFYLCLLSGGCLLVQVARFVE